MGGADHVMHGCIIQLARCCERVLITNYLERFYVEFLNLLKNDKIEGKSSRVMTMSSLQSSFCTITLTKHSEPIKFFVGVMYGRKP